MRGFPDFESESDRGVHVFASFVVVIVLVSSGVFVGMQQPQGPDSSVHPPGASSNGIENASRLVDAHREVLTNAETFKVEQTMNTTRPPDTPRPNRWLWNQTATHRFDLGASPPRVQQERLVVRPDRRVRLQIYATPSTWDSRSDSTPENRTTPDTSRNMTDEEFERWALRYTLESTLPYFDFEFVGREERANRTLYRYTSDSYHGDRSEGVHSLPNKITSAHASLLVDARGLVVEFEYQYTGTSVATTESGDEVTVNTSVNYRWSFKTLNSTTSAPRTEDASSPDLSTSLTRPVGGARGGRGR